MTLPAVSTHNPFNTSLTASAKTPAKAPIKAVAPAPPVATPLSLTEALEKACAQTQAGQLVWQHERKRNTRNKKRHKDTFKARVADNALLELTAEHAEGDATPTQLNQWEVRFKQHETDPGRVLDGKQLALDNQTHAHLITRLFAAVYQSLENTFSHLLPTITRLHQALQDGKIPANVSVIPPSLANPLAGCSTIIQVGDKASTHDYPLMELTRFAGVTRMTLREGDGGNVVTKVPAEAMNNAQLRTALNAMVDYVYRQNKAESGATKPKRRTAS